VAEADLAIRREIAMSYVGQSYQLRVPVPAEIDSGTSASLVAAFQRRHAETYGFANEREPCQLVNLRLIGTGRVERPEVRRLERAGDAPVRALKGERLVWFGEPVACQVYDRDRLRAGDRLQGPLIVEQMDTTTVVPPGASVTVEEQGSLLIEVGGD
jgi:N-methylhydantoinase A